MRVCMIVCAFVLGCKDQIGSTFVGSDAGVPDVMDVEGEAGIVCEDRVYTEDDFRTAFVAAQADLASQGYEVSPLTMEDDEEFSRLANAMTHALKCTPRDGLSGRREGPSGCEVVTEVPEDGPAAGVLYCGRAARTGNTCWHFPWRSEVGYCENGVCWGHDLCYKHRAAELGRLPCPWSNDTEMCDVQFHVGSVLCAQRFQCGFWCMIVATAAAEIDAFQEVGKLEGMECVYGGTGDNPPTCTPSPEICDGLDNDCDGAVDGMARSCGSDVGVCVVGTQTCVAGSWGSCVGEVSPVAEICNGLDDNCNDLTDEGFDTTTCGSGSCQRTVDDCVDGSIQTCVEGVPTPESCDGLDNDCDGTIDEGFIPEPVPCGIGECFRAGVTRCESGVVVPDCVAGTPGEELCDDEFRDENCDGEFNEGCECAIGSARRCGTNIGVCTSGTKTCEAPGRWPEDCSGSVGPGVEACDGTEDEDCDGTVDEECPCAGGVRSCGPPTEEGACEFGTQACTGTWGLCDGAVFPGPEICDGIDNNCDGEVDGTTVDSGFPCGMYFGECRRGTVICWDATINCFDAVGPTLEVLDGRDNDCNGLIDDL